MKAIKKCINQIIEGDCLEVMEHFPACCIDMIVCNLPYGITIDPWKEGSI